MASSESLPTESSVPWFQCITSSLRRLRLRDRTDDVDSSLRFNTASNIAEYGHESFTRIRRIVLHTTLTTQTFSLSYATPCVCAYKCAYSNACISCDGSSFLLHFNSYSITSSPGRMTPSGLPVTRTLHSRISHTVVRFVWKSRDTSSATGSTNDWNKRTPFSNRASRCSLLSPDRKKDRSGNLSSKYRISRNNRIKHFHPSSTTHAP